MQLVAILILLPAVILAAEVYLPCPHECRCTDMITKYAPYNWRMMMSERRLHRLMFGPGRHYFGRRIAESQTNSGRQMTCMGLISMPSYIPRDIKKLCIYGEGETTNKGTITPSKEVGYLRDSPSFRSSNRPIVQDPPRHLTAIDKTKFVAATKITQLALEGHRIKTIESLQFESLGELTDLSLRNNHLKSLAKEAFMSLVKLEKLDLTDNKIKRISSGVFSYTPKLRHLNLKNNKLKKLPRDIFTDLRLLETLDMSDNKISFLQDGIFDNCRELKELRLGNNILSGFQSNLLFYVTRLTQLSLNGNQISALPVTAFRTTTQLRKLDLSHNKLEIVSTAVFGNLNILNELTLSHNNIRNIQDGAFLNLTSLVNLELDNNALGSLRPKMWKGLHNLRRIRLEHNQIPEINNSVLLEMSRINAIDLSFNKIPRIQRRTFEGLLQLREIKLNNNDIKYLEDEAFVVSLLNSRSKVTWIYLQYNKIRQIRFHALYGLPWLKFVNICYNKINSIHQKAFNYARNLNSLILNNNEIASIEEGTFQALKRLKILNLGHNLLSELPFNIFLGLDQLENLNIEFNKLQEISTDSFLHTVNVRSLDFTGNSLQTVRMRTFESMLKLRHLEFAKNDIRRVVQPTYYNGLLKYLSFSHNKLFSLDGNISKTLAFGGLLGLHDNPWICDCHLTWLPKLAMQGYIGLPHKDDITCKQPEVLMAKQVTRLSAADMPCMTKERYRHLTEVMEASFMRHVCNVAPSQVPTLTSSRPSLPRKELAHWHVTLVKSRDWTPICNGVIIDHHWVITTATCWRMTRSSLHTSKNSSVTVLVGETSRKTQEWKIREPQKVVMHPNYTRVDGPNDVALVQLKSLKPSVVSLLTRFPCMLDNNLQKSVLSHRRRGRVSSRLTTKSRIKIRAKSVKVLRWSGLIYSTVKKLKASHDAKSAPLYFDLGKAGWVLAGLKTTTRRSVDFSHQFIPLAPHAAWIDGVLSGRRA